jgi:hypothetical protein
MTGHLLPIAAMRLRVPGNGPVVTRSSVRGAPFEPLGRRWNHRLRDLLFITDWQS